MNIRLVKICAGLGSLLLAGFVVMYIQKPEEKQRETITLMRLQEIRHGIEAFRKEKGRVPNNLEELAPPIGNFIYPSARIFDGWNNAITYKKSADSDRPFLLYSFGENGKDEQGGGDDVNGK